MGLLKVFTAQDTVWWRHFETKESRLDLASGVLDPHSCFDANGNPRRWGFEHGRYDHVGWVTYPNMPPPYNPDLVSNGRVYGEEPYLRYSSGSHPMWGAMWAQKDGDKSTINVMLKMRQSLWPSWGVSVWKFDGSNGVCVRRQPATAADTDIDGNFAGLVYDRFSAETISGRLWWYGLHATAYYNAVLRVDPTTLNVTGEEISLDLFEMPPGNLGKFDVAAFAMDQDQNRAYVRWTGNPVRAVDAYDQTPTGWKWSHRIHAGSAVDQVLMTDTGIVYLIDENDWLTLYDETGAYQGAVRNPRTAAWPFGYMYGWDRLYRRLLFLAGTENELDGASTLKVEGFYPIPEAMYLTPPIPTSRLRKGRKSKFVASLFGSGGESVSSVNGLVKVDGVNAAYSTTDTSGEFVFQHTPAAAGPMQVEVTAPWP